MGWPEPHIRLMQGLEYSDNCWEWKRSTNSMGYGQLIIDGKMTGSHRYSYQYFKGFIPKGMHVLHWCDNRLCGNPNHLFLGTQADNIRDMINKGRGMQNRMAAATHCKRGHRFTRENTASCTKNPNKRICRKCRKLRNDRYYRKRKTLATVKEMESSQNSAKTP